MCFSKHKEKHMDKREEWRRRRAIERHLRGEKARTITVDVARQRLTLYLDDNIFDEWEYLLR
jgi:acetyl-CoA carboxylase carboxyltransferase component